MTIPTPEFLAFPQESPTAALGQFGGQLAGSSLQQLLSNYRQKQEQQQVAQKLSSQFGEELGTVLSQLPPQQRATAITNLLSEQIKQRSDLGKEERKFERQRQLAKEKETLKRETEETKRLTPLRQKGTAALGIVQDMRELLKSTGIAAFKPRSQIPGTQVYKDRQEFNSLKLGLQSLYRELETKGQMPAKIFDTLLKQLPDASYPRSKNEAKLKATEKIIKRYFSDALEEPKKDIKPPLESFFK